MLGRRDLIKVSKQWLKALIGALAGSIQNQRTLAQPSQRARAHRREGHDTGLRVAMRVHLLTFKATACWQTHGLAPAVAKQLCAHRDLTGIDSSRSSCRADVHGTLPNMASQVHPSRLLQHCPPQCSAQGWIAVQVGVLFLSSSALIAGVALLMALTLWRPQDEPPPLSRPTARWLLVLSLWMMLGTAIGAVAGARAWLGLGNWLPFFWFFLAIRPYLATTAARRRLAFWFCAATVPVVVMGWLQHTWGWNNELNALGGLIRWPMSEPLSGTALFDNANVTGAWLALVMPFAALRALNRQQQGAERLLAWMLALGSVATLVLSASRNAIATLLLSWPSSGGRRLQVGVALAAAGFGLLVLARLQGWLPEPLADLVPPALVKKLMMLEEGLRPLHGRRDHIYAMAWQWIAQHPIWGVGAQGFGDLYRAHVIAALGAPLVVITHSHSLLLEFGVSHGLPALLLLLGVIGVAMTRCGRRWWRGELNRADQCWWIAGLIITWLHIWDVPFFDSRLNIAGWLVFAAISAMAERQTERPRGDQATTPQPG
jgi:O-antigen ligase